MDLPIFFPIFRRWRWGIKLKRKKMYRWRSWKIRQLFIWFIIYAILSFSKQTETAFAGILKRKQIVRFILNVTFEYPGYHLSVGFLGSVFLLGCHIRISGISSISGVSGQSVLFRKLQAVRFSTQLWSMYLEKLLQSYVEKKKLILEKFYLSLFLSIIKCLTPLLPPFLS